MRARYWHFTFLADLACRNAAKNSLGVFRRTAEASSFIGSRLSRQTNHKISGGEVYRGFAHSTRRPPPDRSIGAGIARARVGLRTRRPAPGFWSRLADRRGLQFGMEQPGEGAGVWARYLTEPPIAPGMRFPAPAAGPGRPRPVRAAAFFEPGSPRCQGPGSMPSILAVVLAGICATACSIISSIWRGSAATC